MKSLLPIRLLFFVSSAYDGLLGLAFIFAAPAVFKLAGITPPNHWGYVHFAAGTLVIFAWMFLQIALEPVGNRSLVIYGVLLKACYVATVVWHVFHGGIPVLWTWFAVADAAFLALFLWSWARLNALPAVQTSRSR
ncbi:MAG: hypothetical protein WCG76_00470 [Verrucomicrobiota bacterium]